MLLGKHWEIIKNMLVQYSKIANITIIILILIVSAWKLYKPTLRKKHG